MNSEETVPPVSKKSLDRNYRIVAQGKYGGNRNFISFDRNKSEGRKFLVVFAQSELGFAHWTDFPIGEAQNSHFEGCLCRTTFPKGIQRIVRLTLPEY